ncbi:MAG: helix-turn-helix transcriptional regulator [Patescibacteria group bacterium]
MKLQELKQKLLKEDPEFRKEYLKQDLAFGISRLISNIRVHEGISQIELAKLIDTTQSGISRIEQGNQMPSLSTLKKVADSLEYKIKMIFHSTKDETVFDSDGNVDKPILSNWLGHIEHAGNENYDSEVISTSTKKYLAFAV